MSLSYIPKSTLQFLRALKANNNREWFNENKPKYQAAFADMKAFGDTLMDKMSLHDEIEAVKVFRIYRDVRFSKNKTPYKENMSAAMVRATKWLRGGYYFSVEPGNSFAAGGFWAPNSDDLKRIRQEIAIDDKPLRKIIKSAAFKKTFETLDGEQLKTAPRGFPKDHEAVDLLRYKQFLVQHNFTDKQITSEGFANELSKVFKTMRPFFNYMSEVLTTDENGVPIE